MSFIYQEVSGKIIAIEHARFYEQTYRHHERYWFIPMRKHLGWYIKEIRGASHLRNSLMQVSSATEAITLIQSQIERYGDHPRGLTG